MVNLVADVASYQPDTLAFFQAMKNAGVKAVIVKITQGSNPGDAYVNPKARNQIKYARQVGLLVHAYHYAKFHGVADAKAEAAKKKVKIKWSCTELAPKTQEAGEIVSATTDFQSQSVSS